MTPVRVLALGNPHAGDDGAALRACRDLDLDVIAAGRPGPGLLDLWDGPEPVVLVDVVQTGAAPGAILSIDLAALASGIIAPPIASSHGFGPGHAVLLASALGRPLPIGRLIGIEGVSFDQGQLLSRSVAANLAELTRTIRAAVAELGGLRG